MSNGSGFINQNVFFFKSRIQFTRQNIRDTVKMLRNKIIYFKEIEKFSNDNFFIGVISFGYHWKMLLKIKTFGFQKNYTRYEKEVIRNKKFHFSLIYTGYEKMLKNKIVCFRKIYKFAVDYFFYRCYIFFLFIKTVSIIKNSIFPLKYTRYEKYIEKQNCLFQKDPKH